MWRGQWEDLESQARILGGELLKFWEREWGGLRTIPQERQPGCVWRLRSQPGRQAGLNLDSDFRNEEEA